MKGLLLKDWYVLLKQGRIMLLCVVFYTFLSVAGNESFGFFSSLFIAVMPLTLLGIDERNKWDNLAASMPYKRRDLVLSRYVLVGIGLLALSVIYSISSIGYYVILNKTGDVIQWDTVAMAISAGLIYPSLSLPIVYRLGVEKARLWFVILTGALAGAIGVLFYDKININMQVMRFLSENLWFVIIVSILLFLLSAAISVRLYEKREF